MMSDPIRDCAHGSKLGKCDTCDLIAAEEHIAELKSEIQRLREAASKVLSALLPGTVAYIGDQHMRYSVSYSMECGNPILELQALMGEGE